jgi:hypothetical protein
VNILPAHSRPRRKLKRAAIAALVAALLIPAGARAASGQEVIETSDRGWRIRALVQPGPNADFSAPVKLEEAMYRARAGSCKQTENLLKDGEPASSKVRLKLIRQSGTPDDTTAHSPSGSCAGKEQQTSAFLLRAKVSFPLPEGGRKTTGKLLLTKALSVLADKVNARREQVQSTGDTAHFQVILFPVRKNVKGMIKGLARRHHLSVTKSLHVAKCESNFNPKAYNPAGPWAGVYQQDTDFWKGRAKKWGHAGESVFNAYANVDVSLKMARDWGWHHWAACA